MNAANVGLTMSKAGLALTTQSEGLRLKAYLDGNGVPTIGVGHTDKHIHLGMVIDEAQAMAYLERDMSDAEGFVKHYVTVRLVQNQFDALCDFTFNEGAGHLFKSELLRIVNRPIPDLATSYADRITAAFASWVTIAGAPSADLIVRRKAEAELFLRAA